MERSQPTPATAQPFLFHRALRTPHLFLALAVFLSVAAFVAPRAPFSIDGVVYIDMAAAMAERGALQMTPQNLPEGAPIVTKSEGLIKIVDGEATPQYPSGYALIAAPFFALFGASGLILMNALASALALFLTWRLGLFLYQDRWTAGAAALLLGGAAFLSTYALAIWPHALTLAMTLSGAVLCAEAAAANGRHRLAKALLSGVIFGLAVNIRLDAIVLAAAAFLWLRLFAAPRDRLPALALGVGLVPGLLLAAALNAVKFGVFLPFTYGDADGFSAAGRYAPAAAAGAAFLIASLAIDVSHPRFDRLRRGWRPVIIVFVAAAAALAVAGGDFFVRLMHGYRHLLIDIQALAPGDIRYGVFKDAYGYWSFWDLPKKALLQSLPFAPLILLPLAAFFRGRDVTGHALSCLSVGAIVTLYAMNAWSGGMSFNMRYFLPAAPFIAVLSAYGLAQLRKAGGARPNLLRRSIIAGAAAGLGFYFLLPEAVPALAAPATLYPQLVLCAALLGALCVFLWRGRGGTVSVALAGAAIGYAGLLAAADAAGTLGLRAAKTPYEEAYRNHLPTNALIITTAEDHLTAASRGGVTVARAMPEHAGLLHQAAAAFEAAGRCVYVHTEAGRMTMNDPRFVKVPVPDAPVEENDPLQLYALRSQLGFCDPARR